MIQLEISVNNLSRLICEAGIAGKALHNNVLSSTATMLCCVQRHTRCDKTVWHTTSTNRTLIRLITHVFYNYVFQLNSLPLEKVSFPSNLEKSYTVMYNMFFSLCNFGTHVRTNMDDNTEYLQRYLIKDNTHFNIVITLILLRK